jgi:sugar lactone lactonase YvrE
VGSLLPVLGAVPAGAATATGSTAPTLLGTFGSAGTGPGQYSFPVAIAGAPDGTLLIADYDLNRVQRVSSTGSPVATYGSPGAGSGQFNTPVDVAVAPDGSFYVADSGNHRVQRFNSSGTFLASWGSLGTGSGQFNAPAAVEIDVDGNVWVADFNDRLQKFSPTGTRLAGFGTSGTAPGQLSDPDGITILPGGNLAVSERGTSRVQVFTPAGALVTGWGSFGTADGQFKKPAGIDSGPDGETYVADAENNRVQAFSATGAHRWTYSTGLADPRDVTRVGTTLYALDSGNRRVLRLALSPSTTGTPPTAIGVIGAGAGAGPGQLSGPMGVAGAPDGTLLVADTQNNRIQRFNADGSFASTFGSVGTAPGQLKFPIDLAVAADGTIFVADEENHRIQRFDAAGTFLNTWGTLGSGPSQFVFPSGVEVDGDGNVWVTDYSDHVQKFSPTGTLLARFGVSGSASGQLDDPNGITLLPDGNLAISERNTNRVQVFTQAGALVSVWGSAGTAAGQFRSPNGIDNSADGETYVADSDNHRIQAFSSAIHQWSHGTFGSGPNNLNDPRDVTRVGGVLYVADSGNNRIVVLGLAVPPTAALTVTPNTGQAPVQVTADASASRPGGSLISSYRFDFGDGTAPLSTASSSAPHTYTAAGAFTVTVTVTDAAARTATATAPVTVTDPPPPPPPPPAAGIGGIVLSVNGDLRVHPTADPAVWQQVTSGPGFDGKAHWDETGSRVVFQRDQDIWLVNADGTGLRQVPGKAQGAFDFDPDVFGNTVVFSRANGSLKLVAVDLTSGAVTELYDGSPTSAAFSPAGDRIAFTEGGALLTIAPDGTGLRTLRPANAGITSPSWSPDGTELVYAARDEGDNLPRLRTSQADGTSPQPAGPDLLGGFPAFSPDATRIVYAGGNNEVRVLTRATGATELFSASSTSPDWHAAASTSSTKPVTIIVTTTSDDPVDDGCHPAPGDCTLSEAIDDGNGIDPSIDVVIDLPDGGTIKPLRPLPEITRPVTLIGQGTIDDVYPGGQVTDGVEWGAADCGGTLVVLDGTEAGASAAGLRIRTGRAATRPTRIHGLGIVNFGSDGIRVTSSAKVRVQCGAIGSKGRPLTLDGNGGAGLRVVDSVDVTAVGDETIIDNAGDGIWATGSSRRVRTWGARIWDNGGLGLDLGADGVAPNDAGDPDTGPNGLVNRPTIVRVKDNPDKTEVAFRMVDVQVNHNVATGPFRIDIYVNWTCDPSHTGEGMAWVGGARADLRDTAARRLRIKLAGPIWAGSTLTAAVTTGAGTSEFSRCSGGGDGSIGLDVDNDPGGDQGIDPPTTFTGPWRRHRRRGRQRRDGRRRGRRCGR